MKIILSFFCLLFVVSNSHAQRYDDRYEKRYEDKKCLSYWKSGAATCEKKNKKTKKLPVEPSPTVVVPPPVKVAPPVEVKVTPKPELTEKQKLNIQVEKEVDEFLDNHGKPPREFARFMINPTLENALVWAQKYDDILKRTEETTIAWMKAQHILKEQKAGNLNTEIPDLKTKRRAVPDYNLDWNKEAGAFLTTSKEEDGGQGFYGNIATLSSGGSLTAKPEPPKGVEVINDPDMQMKEVFALMQQAQDKSNSVQSDKKAPSVNSNGDIQALLPNREMAEDGIIHVNYYFSAECPFCKKFEVGFQELIDELGDKMEVTCVDMTPSKKDIVNIYGKVDCDWRPLMPNEMKSFGIKSTPTILVNFPGKKAVERLEGYVSTAVLRDYLKVN